MVNRLSDATSPYLLQHKDNPVEWWEWSPEPFAEARERDVPILLSVGYAACHWCQVISRSLKNWPETAKPQVRGTASVCSGPARIAV
ncbi:DUF255 domain-containing protein [Nocardioides jensenii]|uniref:DUF255 domain-containing protein n=1 Tax=Nocardioides jensenii TaxID=1843 RepID=UPI0009E74E4E|nr:DUF255 domain-containing protein [Nocardioides jensenii]